MFSPYEHEVLLPPGCLVREKGMEREKEVEEKKEGMEEWKYYY